MSCTCYLSPSSRTSLIRSIHDAAKNSTYFGAHSQLLPPGKSSLTLRHVTPTSHTVSDSFLVRLRLHKDPDTSLYTIAHQTDFYQPEDITQLILPPLTYAIHLAKRGGAIGSGIAAWAFKLVGLWSPVSTTGTRKEA